jgi:hypothetical protein
MLPIQATISIRWQAITGMVTAAAATVPYTKAK